mmetsp:Transcript_18121/g.34385  ORF Transcript_18121/g.34385 Transcript_18121/m.34385 type:complete len:302 (+) Transcript_18121:61-966(+)
MSAPPHIILNLHSRHRRHPAKTMTTATSTSASPPLPWALDSKQDELDPTLKEAHQRACKDRDVTNDPPCPWLGAELTEPIVLKGLLSDEQIDQVLSAAGESGVWPRGVPRTTKEKEEAANLPDDSTQQPPVAVTPSKELESVAHHLAWADNHVVLYMHMNDHWFVRTFPYPWALIRGGMESRPGMEGVPIQDTAFVGCEESLMQVRTIELHHYSAGGGLVTPGHRDYGSDVTMSVLLSHTDDVSGGDFVTYNEDDGTPVAHKMERGDAILFQSEKLHNISTVKRGVRKSLVVELWPSKPCY